MENIARTMGTTSVASDDEWSLYGISDLAVNRSNKPDLHLSDIARQALETLSLCHQHESPERVETPNPFHRVFHHRFIYQNQPRDIRSSSESEHYGRMESDARGHIEPRSA